MANSHRRRSADARPLPSEDAFHRVRGEDPLDAAGLEAVQLWIDAYQDMVAFEQYLLHHARRRLATLRSEPARRHLQEVDITLLEIRHDRIRRRLELWQQRARELQERAQPSLISVAPEEGRKPHRQAG
ncbi:MAG: hypothetical protein E6J14_07080 [Chloroflexi bacterium]|nr:MAG: hypothetical protein E6J14_07080 [Chloroflexota bacterium]